VSTLTRQAFIGAGANLGDRCAMLRAAVARLRAAPGVKVLACSTVYETDPVGPLDQPAFLNAVVGIETSLSPEELLATLLEVERSLGRVRTIRWGPRTIDLDLLVFEGERRATESLHLPHPRTLERAFVTVPLRELIEREPFRRPCWAALRQQLAASPATSLRASACAPAT